MKKLELGSKVYIVREGENLTKGTLISRDKKWHYCLLKGGTVTGFSPDIIYEKKTAALEHIVVILKDKLTKSVKLNTK